MRKEIRKSTSIFLVSLLILSFFVLIPLVSAWDSPPTIEFVSPTPPNNNETGNSYVEVNVSVTDTEQTSSFIDWDESLLGYWNFDHLNSTGAYDNSTNSHFATFEGGLLESDNTTGKFGTAMTFDGSSDHMITSLDVSDTQGSFSVEGWYYSVDSNIPPFSCDQRMVSARKLTGSTKWCVALDNNKFALGKTGGAAITGSVNVINTWHHFVLTYDGTTMKGYLDNNPTPDVTAVTDLGTSNYGTVLIGTWNPGDGAPRIFNGSIDEVRVWNRVLTLEEMNASYNSTVKNYLNRNFTGLTTHNYSYYAHAINATGGENVTETRHLNVIIDITDPISSVDSIIPYEQTSSPLQINAVASDTGGAGLANVTLYYRNSTDNSTWGEGGYNWWNSEWNHRKLITINHTKVTGDLTNFPILVHFDFDSELSGRAQSDGDDIVFTTETNVKLNHEIEYYDNATGNLSAWVNITSLSGSVDTEIYMYYGNSTCSSQGNIAGTWDNNYAIIQHLNESSGTLYDSTSNDNDGTNDGADYVSNSKIAGGYDFERGNTDFMDCGNDLSLHITAAITIEAWVNMESATGYILMKNLGSSTDAQYGIYTPSTQVRYYPTGNPTSASSSVPLATWTHVVFTRTGTTGQFYINGVASGGSATCSIPSHSDYTLCIGRRKPNNYYFDGIIDEVRISNVLRSTSWITTTYNTANSPGSFLSVGSEEGGGWQKWLDASNPGLTSPWQWDFNFPNGTGYYEFYSRSYDNASNYENVPNSADAICNYTRQWNYSQPLAWRIINITNFTILRLSSSGNLAIAGILYEETISPPVGNTVAFKMNNTLWLTKSGNLYLEGSLTTTSHPLTWKILNATDVVILSLSREGNLTISGELYEGV